ncbi:lipid-transfer protein [Steroidobacter denitrificans]|uniref:Lipid-transfer protein n=1 Tax=Steroidobacter denitrificans TaxID=465721 RepID=A0A127FDF8_STEDE|nr:lipid-transfer protein [Steroidobacter denitrificans]AMN47760.1 lipid-transfer protein [Steroidobacter denitrificans]
MIKDKAAIVGIAETAFARRLEASECELASMAILAALEDAGIAPSEVDALSSYTMERTEEIEIAGNLGFGDIRFFSQVGYGGGAGCGTVLHLAMAVASGQAEVAVAWRSRKRGSGPRVWATSAERLYDGYKYTRPYGLVRPADELAVLTRRYMHEFGATREHLANVALTCRRMANNNPRAAMYPKPLTREQYMAARWIAEPLCLYDNCLETDGALACVIVSAERARDCRHRPVYIHAGAQGISAPHPGFMNDYCGTPFRTPSYAAAKALWRGSDFKPDDIKVAQIYDAFTTMVLLSFEAYGFCGRGEGAAFTENGALDPGGRLALNTSGGSLSEAYVHGFNLINEGVRQMRGSSANQVPGADVCLVTSCDDVPTSALILRN